MAKKFTARERMFCRQYLLHRNATRAAREAGYSVLCAQEIGCRVLARTHIAEWIAKREEALAVKHDVSMDRIVQELAVIGFSRPTDVCRVENGKWVVDTDVDPARLAAVKELRINPDGSAVVKFHDKPRALVALGVHLGGFVRRPEQLDDDEPPPAIRRVEQLGAVECARKIMLALKDAQREIEARRRASAIEHAPQHEPATAEAAE